MKTSVATLSIVVATILVVSAPAFAEDAPKEAPKVEEPKPTWTFALHGFVGGSLYMQDALLGPSGGGQAIYVNPGTATGQVVGSGDRSQRNMVFGGDVRSSRLNFSIAGPNKVFFGATPKGIAEIDFFGGNGFGGFGEQSVFPRLRYATANLEWQDTTLMFGQWHQFALGVNTLGVYPLGLPEWVGHTAFPVCLEAGCLGWRSPGAFFFQRLKLAEETRMEIAVNIAKGVWANNANPGSGTVSGTTATNPSGSPDFDFGDASGLPQIEGRVTIAGGKTWAAMLGGHFSEFTAVPTLAAVGTGTCAAAAGTGVGPQFCSAKSSWIGDLGVMVNAMGITFKGHAWYGQNPSSLAAALLQFQTAAGATTLADVPWWGGFAQLGYDFTKELGLWVMVGTEQPGDFDKAYAAYGASNAVRLGNTMTQGMLRWKEGGWAAGLEVTHWHTKYAYGALDGNQYMLSCYYFF